MTERVEKCCFCYYWEFKQNVDGVCRRHAPRPEIKLIDQKTEVVLPLTKKEDWCGDFRVAE